MLMTVLGPVQDGEAGVILPHEHIMVGFIEDGKLSPDDYDRNEVVETILPYLLKLKEAGCSTFVDTSPEYLGRDPVILKHLSEASGLHIITNTGYYKEPYLPPAVRAMSDKELAAIWVKEAADGIHGTGVKPGYIKIALNDGKRINEVQQTILRAAIRTSLETDLAIQCHTVGGDIAQHAAEIIEREGLPFERFIWIHAQTEPDLSVHEKLAAKGMWISIDNIGQAPFEEHCRLLQGLIDRGMQDCVLLSQDTGFYHVGEEKGGQILPYHRLFTEFIPFALDWGIDAGTLGKFNRENPARALRVRN